VIDVHLRALAPKVMDRKRRATDARHLGADLEMQVETGRKSTG
jgi:hypothetical protein